MRTAAALALFALLSPTTTAAGTCAPRAHLDGDREAITHVGEELHRLGVATEPPPVGCTAVEAAVQVEQDGGISVAIRDASRRSEGRVVGNAAVAAAWIDSWVRDDLGGFDEGLAPPAATPPRIDRDQPSVHTTVQTQPATTSLLDQVSLRASYAHAWTGDNVAWDGLEVAGCVRFGFACVGVRVAALFQPQLAVQQVLASRSELSALATASTTISVGRIGIVPELGLGVGRTNTSRVDGCVVPPAPGCDSTTDPATGNCPPPPKGCIDASGAVFVGDNFEAITYSPRAAASLRIEIPLFDHVWLDGGASVVASPFRHDGMFQPMQATGPNPKPAGPALPGEAFASYQLGIGLRIGAP